MTLLDKQDFTWIQFQTALLTYENIFEQIHSFQNMSINATTANLAHASRSNSTNENKNKGNWRGSPRGGRGRGRGRNQGSRPICQVCGKLGHTASICYYIYNQAYMGVPLEKQQNQNGISSNFTTPYSAYFTNSESTDDQSWYVDSRASHHVTNNAQALQQSSQTDGNVKITIANGNKLPVIKTGSSLLQISNQNPLKLKNIIYSPSIYKNLLSVSQLTSHNDKIIEFDNSSFFVKDKSPRKVLLQGTLRDGLYKLTPSPSLSQNPQILFTSQSNNTPSLTDWHKTLGHPSNNVLFKIIKACNLNVSNENLTFCSACQEGKSHKLPFPKSKSQASKPLKIIHTDLWGPAHTISKHGFRYYIMFLDDFSRYSWIYPLKQKSDTLSSFVNFKNMVEKQFNTTIKIVQSDSRGEYQAFNNFLKQQGIIHYLTCPHTSEQNGRFERKHKHITETGLTLLAHAQMPLTFWWEAFHTATYLINRLPTPTLQHKSPFQVLFKKTQDYKSLHPFGCVVFPCLTSYNTHKLQFHSVKCMFIGYSENQKGYTCISP